MKWRRGIKVAMMLLVIICCIFEYTLRQQNGSFFWLEAVLQFFPCLLMVCLAAWCSVFLFLTFCLNDLPLIGLLLIAAVGYFITAQPGMDALTLLVVVTLGKGAVFLVAGNWKPNTGKPPMFSQVSGRESAIGIFLVGLVGLLVFSSWWNLGVTNPIYYESRWTGLT